MTKSEWHIVQWSQEENLAKGLCQQLKYFNYLSVSTLAVAIGGEWGQLRVH